MDDRHEQGAPDDRPENREGLPADVKHERLRQLQLDSDPRPKEGSDKANGDGDDEPPANLPHDRSADRSTYGRDYE